MGGRILPLYETSMRAKQILSFDNVRILGVHLANIINLSPLPHNNYVFACTLCHVLVALSLIVLCDLTIGIPSFMFATI